jgi:hypothetical protein
MRSQHAMLPLRPARLAASIRPTSLFHARGGKAALGTNKAPGSKLPTQITLRPAAMP